MHPRPVTLSISYLAYSGIMERTIASCIFLQKEVGPNVSILDRVITVFVYRPIRLDRTNPRNPGEKMALPGSELPCGVVLPDPVGCGIQQRVVSGTGVECLVEWLSRSGSTVSSLPG